MTGGQMHTSDFDFHLPPEQIAQQPLARRDDSRLMVVVRARGTIEHRHFRDLPELIPGGDVLVLNRTRVWGRGGVTTPSPRGRGGGPGPPPPVFISLRSFWRPSFGAALGAPRSFFTSGRGPSSRSKSRIPVSM